MNKSNLNGVQMVVGGEVPKEGFQVCQMHHTRMIKLLKEFGVEDHVAKTEEEVNALMSTGKSDPILDISKVLFTLAVNAIGAKDLAVIRCPVCAFRKFDFLAKITGIVALKYQEKTSIFMPPEHAKLILPS